MVVAGMVFTPFNNAKADIDYESLVFFKADSPYADEVALAFVEYDGHESEMSNVRVQFDNTNVIVTQLTASYVKPNYKEITCNGHTDSSPAAGANFNIPKTWLNYNNYNDVTIKDFNNDIWHFVIRYGRVGGVAPSAVTADPVYDGGDPVAGCVNVTWTPGSSAQSGQTYRIYVDGVLHKSDVTGTAKVINNVPAGKHTISVSGFYAGIESSKTAADPITVSQGVLYSPRISVEGFQIRSNYATSAEYAKYVANNTAADGGVAYRSVMKAPKKNSTISVDGVNYTVTDYGTSFCLDTQMDGTAAYDASYTLLDEAGVSGKEYDYVGIRNPERTFGYVASGDAIVDGYKSGDNENDYYAFTMQHMSGDATKTTIHIRAFVKATHNGQTRIIYGKQSTYTSVVDVANFLYVNSMAKNEPAHEYLFNAIAGNSATSGHPKHLNSTIEYGWETNLYIGFKKIVDAWNPDTHTEEMQYVPIGDWRLHANSSFQNAAASSKGRSNEEMQLRVDNTGMETGTEWGVYNWGIQMKLPNVRAYKHLENGVKYNLIISYNSTKAGIMRIKPEGNGQDNGDDMIYDFDAIQGSNVHKIQFIYDKQRYIGNPGGDPSIVLSPGAFTVGNSTADTPHIDYHGTHAVGDIGGFPTGTIISNVEYSFEEAE